MKTLAYIAAVIVAISPILAFAEGTPAEAAQKQAQANCNALVKADYPTVVSYTHPKVVEMMGGPDKMVEALKVEQQKMQQSSITFVSVEADKPGAVLSGADEKFCVVPTVTRTKGPQGGLKQPSYLLGVSTDGVKWTFLDGATLTMENLKQTFPKVPASLALPEKKQPVAE